MDTPPEHPPLPIAPAWMLDCASCAPLYERYLAALAAADPRALVETDVALAAHLVAEHLAALPHYATGCPNCQEWAALAPRIERALGPLVEGDLRHRAAHLYAPTIT